MGGFADDQTPICTGLGLLTGARGGYFSSWPVCYGRALGVGSLDTSTVGFQVGLAVFAAASGAVFCNYLLPGKKEQATKYDLRGALLTDIGEVRVGDTHLEVTNDNRVYINASAARAIASASPEPMDSDHNIARDRDRREREREHQRRLKEIRAASGSSDDPWNFWIGAFAAFIVGAVVISGIVLFYLRYLRTITTASELLATAVLFFTLSAAVTAALRKVKLDRWLKTQLTINLLLGVAALYSVRWLSDPLAAPDRRGFDHLLSAAGKLSWPALYHSDWNLIFAVVYQIFGLAFLMLSLFFIAAHALTIFGIADVAARTRADSTYVSGRVQQRLMQLFGGPRRCWWTAFFITVISLTLLTGLASTYTIRLSNLVGTKVPVTHTGFRWPPIFPGSQ